MTAKFKSTKVKAKANEKDKPKVAKTVKASATKSVKTAAAAPEPIVVTNGHGSGHQVNDDSSGVGVQPSVNRSHVLLFHNLNQMISDIFDGETGGFPTTTQYALFNVIHSLDGPSQTAIGLATGMDRSTVAEVLKRMQARHAINRTRLATDERAFSITLTEKGKEALARGHKAMKKVETALASADGFQKAVAWATILTSGHDKKRATNGSAKEPSPKISRNGPVGGNFGSGSGTSANTRRADDEERADA